MGKTPGADVLLALVDVEPPGIGGYEVLERLTGAGVRSTAGDLLVTLLRLEAVGDVVIDRHGDMRFSPTESGRERAIETVGGEAKALQLVMADLVDFTSIVSAHGDETARVASATLAHAAERGLRSGGGRLVKVLGDGCLGWLPIGVDAQPIVHSIAAACLLPTGGPWPMRAACHPGTPISFRGDLYGADVNVVARLCAEAEPDQLVQSTSPTPNAEQLHLRGVPQPVSVSRVALR